MSERPQPATITEAGTPANTGARSHDLLYQAATIAAALLLLFTVAI